VAVLVAVGSTSIVGVSVGVSEMVASPWAFPWPSPIPWAWVVSVDVTIYVAGVTSAWLWV
jgi:hypothetical protein